MCDLDKQKTAVPFGGYVMATTLFCPGPAGRKSPGLCSPRIRPIQCLSKGETGRPEQCGQSRGRLSKHLKHGYCALPAAARAAASCAHSAESAPALGRMPCTCIPATWLQPMEPTPPPRRCRPRSRRSVKRETGGRRSIRNSESLAQPPAGPQRPYSHNRRPGSNVHRRHTAPGATRYITQHRPPTHTAARARLQCAPAGPCHRQAIDSDAQARRESSPLTSPGQRGCGSRTWAGARPRREREDPSKQPVTVTGGEAHPLGPPHSDRHAQ